MSVTDEMIDAYMRAIHATQGSPMFRENIRVALEAALSVPAQGAVKVKALEWQEEAAGYQVARTAIGWYEYLPARTMGKYQFEPGIRSVFLNAEQRYPTEAEAKAAAQADYERRILSALHPAPAHCGEREALERENERLREALFMAARRLDLLHLGGVGTVNGINPLIGADEARAALEGTKP